MVLMRWADFLCIIALRDDESVQSGGFFCFLKISNWGHDQ
jgi:hypothetical protein